MDLQQIVYSMERTDEQIVEQTLALARSFYRMMGCEVREGYCFQHATHPQEKMCWQMAIHAQDVLTQTDVENCLP